ncbi:TetR/AcrR family transcriptional regulator [Shimia haliotis]|uniref:Transcriptional regulator, TetR family n=1 Tax=Shimia haliotis TaxID=1280847 RepID=A0A1I4E0C3_9RHOB|nr:TetR/AcrR family transcriptional regulator [Shimia haliotis]SFK97571.1 transcriptional regulator, TetR family [Shimia haliotis]
MARPREFDMDTALDGALDIFWRQGYVATNLPDLLMAMGLTRGSFYKAFRDKLSVYIAALDRYDDQVVSATVATLAGCDAGSAQACLSVLFSPEADARKGCFICNAVVELGPANETVAAKAEAMTVRLRNGILGVLDRFEVGEVGEKRTATADLILHLYFGHKAIGKGGKPREDWSAHLGWILGQANDA